MKLSTFKYTKADGSSSERVVVVMSEPSKFVSGIDVSELDDEMQVEFYNQVKELHEKYIQDLNGLEALFDVNYRYRQFKPENMAQLVEEDF